MSVYYTVEHKNMILLERSELIRCSFDNLVRLAKALGVKAPEQKRKQELVVCIMREEKKLSLGELFAPTAV